MAGSAEVVVSFQDAYARVVEHARALREIALATETVGLLDCMGRVLALPVRADRDQPPFDRVTRDGFAVHARELTSGKPLKIIGQVRAGQAWEGAPLDSGDAIEIMTGAPLPAGTDAVVMIEHVEVADGVVRLLPSRKLNPGDNFVPRGNEAKAGAQVIAAGTRIGAAEIAEAATCGGVSLQVCMKPSVAIVATGDELVTIDQSPNTQQIRNSNSYALAALISSAGGTPTRLEIARDTRDDLFSRVSEGRKHDLILLSGGVSMGRFDLVEEVLAELGAEFLFTGVKMQPGKPVVFGRLPERTDERGTHPWRYFFGLPGNPISTQVTFHCFVEPFLRILAGGDIVAPKFVQATLNEDVEAKPGLTRILPAHIKHDFHTPSVKLIEWHGSGDLAANARANCYAVFPPERAEFRGGDVITVLLR